MNEIFDTIIIGGGITGLVSAYKLSKQNKKVLLIERSSELGGLIKPLSINNYSIEGLYHHIFVKDVLLIDLLNELGISVEWKYTSTAFCYYKGIYEFTHPYDLLNFTPLSLKEKFQISYFFSKLLKIKNFSEYDNVNAKEWLINQVGLSLFEKFFEPLLWAKFNTELNKVSAAWFIGRISLRSKRSWKGEKLGYIKGGYINLIKKLQEKIVNTSTNIFLNSDILKIEKENNLFSCTVLKDNKTINLKAKTLLSTIKPKFFFELTNFILIDNELKYIDKVNELPYQGTICVLLGMQKKITDYYWINVMEKDINFGAIIEHTNFQPYSDYNEHIFYLASYPSPKSNLWNMKNEEIFKIYYNDLIKLFPDKCKENNVNWYKIIRTDESGLLYSTGLKSVIPNVKTAISGIYIGGIFNSYPDRPVNEVIRISYECIKEINLYLIHK